MEAQLYYDKDNKFVAQDENEFSSLDGVTKIRIRTSNGDTLCIEEINGDMVITNNLTLKEKIILFHDLDPDTFSCHYCKDRLKVKNCNNCPIYCQHFSYY